MPFCHRASETVQLLKQMTPDFIPPTLWPPKSLHLNPKEYAVWGIMQFTRRRLRMSANCVSGLWRNGNNSASMWLTMWSDSGAGDCGAVSMQTVDSLNILCEWHSDYHNGRHCRFLGVWLCCIDCIAIYSALYSLALIRLFTQRIFIIYSTKSNVSRICIFSTEHLLQILCKLTHYYTNYSEK